MLVGNFPVDTTEEELVSFFEAVGKVSNVELLADKSGRCKGFAFVTMVDPAKREDLIPVLDKRPFKGRILSVSVSDRPARSKPAGFFSKLFGAK